MKFVMVSIAVILLTGCFSVPVDNAPAAATEVLNDLKIENYEYQSGSATVKLILRKEEGGKRAVMVDVKSVTVEKRFDKKYIGFSGECPQGATVFTNAKIHAPNQGLYDLISKKVKDSQSQLR